MLPHSAEIEKSVLGCLLMGKADYIIKLNENDFMIELHREIYKVILMQYENKGPIDSIEISDLLKVDNSLQIVVGLESFVSTPENVEHYIQTLKTYTMRREIVKASIKAKEIAENGVYDTGIELKADVLQVLDIPVYDNRKTDNSLNTAIMTAIDDIEEKFNSSDEDKLFTGFYDLDRITAGLHPEELTIVAARPGIGKTAFALQLMLNMAKKGCKCLFVSREMSTIQVAKRIISNLAVVDGQKLRFCKSLTVDDWAKLTHITNETSQLSIELNDRMTTIQEIRAYCRELKNKNALDVLIVDYLQLCRSSKKTESRRQEVEDISRQLKEISLEFGIPVITLSQLSRDSAKNEREPELHDLRESGSIEQDADNVIFLHVPKDTDETQDCFDIKVMVAKQRNGPTRFIWLKYFRRTFKFCNISLR